MKKLTLTVLLSLPLLSLLAGVASAQTADDIVEKHLAAMGGRAALAKLTSRKSTGTITIATQGVELSGPAEIYLKAPNKSHAIMRLDLSSVGASGDLTVEQLFDGQKGWSLNSMQGDSEIAGRMLDNMRNNVFPSPLLHYKEAGTKLAVLPREKINGRDAIVLGITPTAGSPSRVFFDAETYLIVRTITTVDAPTGESVEQTSDLSDYRAVDGVQVAFTVMNSSSLQTLTLKFAKVEHNVAIDDAIFVKK